MSRESDSAKKINLRWTRLFCKKYSAVPCASIASIRVVLLSLIHLFVFFPLSSIQNGNVCCSVDLECLHNNWSKKAGTILLWGKLIQFLTIKTNAAVRDGSFILQTITKVSTWGRYLGVALGPTTMLGLSWVTFTVQMHISLWSLIVLSVVKLTFSSVKSFADALKLFHEEKLRCIYFFNLCTFTHFLTLSSDQGSPNKAACCGFCPIILHISSEVPVRCIYENMYVCTVKLHSTYIS